MGNTDTSQASSRRGETDGNKSKAVAAAGAAVAGVAGVAGGIAVVARDTRRQVLGIRIGKRSRFQSGASAVTDAAGTVVERVREPASRVGSRFSREP